MSSLTLAGWALFALMTLAGIAIVLFFLHR